MSTESALHISEKRRMVLPRVRELEEENVIHAVVRIVHGEHQARILNICSKIKPYEGEYQDVCSPEIDIPRVEENCFKLGDRVRIKDSLSAKDVKSIQRRTCGWFEQNKGIFGRSGYVTLKTSKWMTNIAVRFPEMSFVAYLYPGVLEHDDFPDKTNILDPSIPFKQGDWITLIQDPDLIKILQSGLSFLTHYNIGQMQARGRVIKIIGKNALLTFNEFEAFLVNPALLRKVGPQDQTPIVQNEDIEIGKKVKITNDMEILLSHDEEFHGFSRNVSQIADKEVVVVGNSVGKFFTVCCEEKGPSWIVQSSLLVKDKENEQMEDRKALGSLFLPGDTVKLKDNLNLRKVLQDCNIPTSLLEDLHTCAKVLLYESGNSLHVLLKAHSNYLLVPPYLLTTASKEEQDIFKKFEDKLQLEKGDSVYLDAGRPNYVRQVLEEFGGRDELILAFTTVAKILGFVGSYHAVIEYPDGKKYKIHKKYLTDPGKFHVVEAKMEIEWEDVVRIQKRFLEVIQESFMKVGNENPYLEVLIMSLEHGDPSTIRLTIFSETAADEDVYGCLQNPSCVRTDIELIAENTVIFEVDSKRVKIEFKMTNKRKLDEQKDVGSLKVTEKDECTGTTTRREEDVLLIQETTHPGNEAVPFVDQNTDQQPGNTRAEHPRERLLHRLPLINSALGRRVDLFYEIGESLRATVDTETITIRVIRGDGNRNDIQGLGVTNTR